MIIEVRDEFDEVVFEGSADEWLEENYYDEDLEIILDKLDYCKIGKIIRFGEYSIEKMPNVWDE